MYSIVTTEFDLIVHFILFIKYLGCLLDETVSGEVMALNVASDL